MIEIILYILGFLIFAVMMITAIATPCMLYHILDHYPFEDPDEIFDTTGFSFVTFIILSLANIFYPFKASQDNIDSIFVCFYLMYFVLIYSTLIGIITMKSNNKKDTDSDNFFYFVGIILFLPMYCLCVSCYIYIPNFIFYLRIGLWIAFAFIAIWYMVKKKLCPWSWIASSFHAIWNCILAPIYKIRRNHKPKKKLGFEVVCAKTATEPAPVKLTPQARILAQFLGISKKEITLNELECGWYKFREKNQFNSSTDKNLIQLPAEAAYQNLRKLFE